MGHLRDATDYKFHKFPKSSCFHHCKTSVIFLPLSLTAVAAGVNEQKQEYFKS